VSVVVLTVVLLKVVEGLEHLYGVELGARLHLLRIVRQSQSHVAVEEVEAAVDVAAVPQHLKKLRKE
jgi:hypothetical protein